MKVGNFFKSISVCLAIGGLVLASTVPVKADAGDPNGANNTPEQGWSLWKRWENLRNEKIDFGRSNTELGAGMELEKICFGEVGTANTDKKKLQSYWYRISENVGRIGEGKIEYGCWENGRFKSTIAVNALISSATAQASSTQQSSSTQQASTAGDRCRRVQTPLPNDGVAIRSEPNLKATRVGGVGNGDTLTLTTNPPTIKNVEGRNWVEVEAPVRGWVNNGGSNSLGNLKMCSR